MGVEAYLFEPGTRRTFWLGKRDGLGVADALRGCLSSPESALQEVRDLIGDNAALDVCAFVASCDDVSVRDDSQWYDDEAPGRVYVAALPDRFGGGGGDDPDPKAARVAAERARFTTLLRAGPHRVPVG